MARTSRQIQFTLKKKREKETRREEGQKQQEGERKTRKPAKSTSVSLQVNGTFPPSGQDPLCASVGSRFIQEQDWAHGPM